MGNFKFCSILFCIVCFFLPMNEAEMEDIKDVDFYKAFGEEQNLLFLKDISIPLHNAFKNKNAKALGGYAVLFFYAEKISGKKIPELTGEEILEKATKIALKNQDKKTLKLLAKIWKENYFGANNSFKARKIKKISEKIYLIKLVPSKKIVALGERVRFKVINTFMLKIPLEELTFKARYGQFWKDTYKAPIFPCMDVINAFHIPTGKVAHAIIIVKKRSFRFKQPIIQRKTWKKNNLFKPRTYNFSYTGTPVNAIEYYQGNEDMLAKLLSNSEAAKVKSLKKIYRRIRKITAPLSDIFAMFDIYIRFDLSKEMVLAGVKTSEAYVYKERPRYLRVKATIKSDWIVESLKRSAKKKNISIDKSMWENVKNFLPNKVEVEGVIDLHD